MGLIKLFPNDNVLIATENHKKGETIISDGESITLLSDVNMAHKIASRDIKKGEPIIKYDNVCSYAVNDIKKGEWVHTHNVISGLGDNEREYYYDYNQISILPGRSDRAFMGYERANGKVGIRNQIAVISTVFCANGPAMKVAEMAKMKYPESEFFDGIVGLEQEYGCSQHGDDKQRALEVSAKIAMNPNFGGVLLVSNGCETNPPLLYEPFFEEMDKSRLRVVICQDVEDEFEECMKNIDELYKIVKNDRRTPVNISKLHIAVNCGGSDGLSGITANTLVGMLTDRLVEQGSTVSMTEISEMMGAEHILMNRCKDRETYEDMVDLMNWYYGYLSSNGMPHMGTLIAEGNMAGGISTLEEKSLGCINKGGHAAVMEIVDYGDSATSNGFVIVKGPGNDGAGVSAQIAAGAVLVVFTTGRGTPCGFAVPTFRLSSNTELAKRKPHWIDFDAGCLLETESESEKDKLAEELVNSIIETANGKYHTNTERMGYYMQSHFKQGLMG